MVTYKLLNKYTYIFNRKGFEFFEEKLFKSFTFKNMDPESLKPETLEDFSSTSSSSKEITPIYDNFLMPIDNASKLNSKSVDEIMPHTNNDLQIELSHLMDQTNSIKRLSHSKSLKLNKTNRSCKQDEGLTSNPSEKKNPIEDFSSIRKLIRIHYLIT